MDSENQKTGASVGEPEVRCTALVDATAPDDNYIRWMAYLEDTGEINRYRGDCGCYTCERIRQGYGPWLEARGQADFASTPGDHRSPDGGGTDASK